MVSMVTGKGLKDDTTIQSKLLFVAFLHLLLCDYSISCTVHWKLYNNSRSWTDIWSDIWDGNDQENAGLLQLEKKYTRSLIINEFFCYASFLIWSDKIS